MNNNQSIPAIVVLYYSKHLVRMLIDNVTEKIPGLDEIILVDNGSTDGCREFVATAYPGIKTIFNGLTWTRLNLDASRRA